MASTWNETRAKRPPREGRVAEHRARIDAEVRAYRLKEIREEQGLTQVELAERMHVTQPSVSDLERGALDRAGLSTIRAYVEALGGKIEIIAFTACRIPLTFKSGVLGNFGSSGRCGAPRSSGHGHTAGV